jgi:phosphoribosylglycinamide formyltransferase-1
LPSNPNVRHLCGIVRTFAHEVPPVIDPRGVSSPLQIAVLISGSGTTLENLSRRIADRRLRNVVIKRVISSRRAVRGVAVAHEANLPLEIIRPIDFPTPEAFSERLTEMIDAAAVDVVILGGFLCFWRIPPRYAGRVLNIHPALLPRFGGRGFYGGKVHEAVLAAGETESGCTVHVVDNEYDHGPIVAQRRVPVMPDDTPELLADRVGAAERELYPEVIQRIANEGLDWLPQPDIGADR